MPIYDRPEPYHYNYTDERGRTAYDPAYGDARYNDAMYLMDEAISRLVQDSVDQLASAAVQALSQAMAALDVSKMQEYINSHLVGLYEKLGEAAWRSMMSSFGQVVTRRGTPSYRAGRNRLPGALRQALGNKSTFYTVDQYGLSFGNIDALTKAAAHWRRITFGAGGEGQGIHTTREISMDGVALSRIVVEGSPSSGFAMPPGFWKGNEFYPYTHRLAVLQKQGRPMEWKPTKGIAAHDYFTAAADRMARELPALLDKLIAGAVAAMQEGAAKPQSIERKFEV
jgi:hypothetical protein